MRTDNSLAASNELLRRTELDRLLDECQQKISALQQENNKLKRVNNALKNRLQLLLRSGWAIVKARKNA